MLLEEKRYTLQEWEALVPSIKDGTLKDKGELLADEFLVVYQAFSGVLEDTDGTLYKCNGWHPPGLEPYVEVAKFKTN